MKNVFTQTAFIILFVVTFSACTTIYPGEVGFVVHKGMIKPGILTQGRLLEDSLITYGTFFG